MPRFKYLRNHQPDPVLETPSNEVILQMLGNFHPSYAPDLDPKNKREYQRVRHVQSQYFVSAIELFRQVQARKDGSLEGRCAELVKSISGLDQLQGVSELAIIKRFSALWLGGQGEYTGTEIYNAGVQIYRAHRHTVNRAKRAGKKQWLTCKDLLHQNSPQD